MKFLERQLNFADEKIWELEPIMASGTRNLVIRSQELNALSIELQKLINGTGSTEPKVEKSVLLKEINELKERTDREKIFFDECKASVIRTSADLAKAISEKNAIELQMLKLREEESVAAQQRNETDEPNADLVLS